MPLCTVDFTRCLTEEGLGTPRRPGGFQSGDGGGGGDGGEGDGDGYGGGGDGGDDGDVGWLLLW